MKVIIKSKEALPTTIDNVLKTSLWESNFFLYFKTGDDSLNAFKSLKMQNIKSCRAGEHSPTGAMVCVHYPSKQNIHIETITN